MAKKKRIEKHSCEVVALKYDLFGVAVTTCHEDEKGFLWIGNSKHKNTVNFCPQCGYESKQQDEDN